MPEPTDYAIKFHFSLFMNRTDNELSHSSLSEENIIKRQAVKGNGEKSDMSSGVTTNLNSLSDSATAGQFTSDSQSVSTTGIHTKISTKSDARSGANAASKVKTFAHTQTNLKVLGNKAKEMELPPQNVTTPTPGRPGRPGPSRPPGGPGPPGITTTATTPTTKPKFVFFRLRCPPSWQYLVPCPAPPCQAPVQEMYHQSPPCNMQGIGQPYLFPPPAPYNAPTLRPVPALAPPQLPYRHSAYPPSSLQYPPLNPCTAPCPPQPPLPCNPLCTSQKLDPCCWDRDKIPLKTPKEINVFKFLKLHHFVFQ